MEIPTSKGLLGDYFWMVPLWTFWCVSSEHVPEGWNCHVIWQVQVICGRCRSCRGGWCFPFGKWLDQFTPHLQSWGVRCFTSWSARPSCLFQPFRWVWWHHIMVWICISLVTDEIEHLGIFTNYLEILFGGRVYSSLLPIFLSSYPVFLIIFFSWWWSYHVAWWPLDLIFSSDRECLEISGTPPPAQCLVRPSNSRQYILAVDWTSHLWSILSGRILFSLRKKMEELAMEQFCFLSSICNYAPICLEWPGLISLDVGSEHNSPGHSWCLLCFSPASLLWHAYSRSSVFHLTWGPHFPVLCTPQEDMLAPDIPLFAFVRLCDLPPF